jgi:hypothetical protein
MQNNLSTLFDWERLYILQTLGTTMPLFESVLNGKTRRVSRQRGCMNVRYVMKDNGLTFHFNRYPRPNL